MIWLKLIASVMVGPGCFGLGYYYFSQYGKRLELLKGLRWFLVMLRGEIGYGRVSLAEACRKVLPDAHCVLQRAISEMEKTTDSGISFSELFRREMLKAFQNTSLGEEDRKNFFLWLGDTVFADEQMQIASLNRSIERLEATIAAMEREYTQYRKMTLGLGTLGGCLLLVILW